MDEWRLPEVIVAGGGIIDPALPSDLAKLAELSIRLYPEYLSTVEGLSGRSVRRRTQAAINTDEEDGINVAMRAQEARGRVPGLAGGRPPAVAIEPFSPGRASK